MLMPTERGGFWSNAAMLNQLTSLGYVCLGWEYVILEVRLFEIAYLVFGSVRITLFLKFLTFSYSNKTNETYSWFDYSNCSYFTKSFVMMYIEI